MKANCASCSFAVALDKTPGFHCHFNPPQVVVWPHPEQGAVFEQHFPYMAADEWCGRWQESQASLRARLPRSFT